MERMRRNLVTCICTATRGVGHVDKGGKGERGETNEDSEGDVGKVEGQLLDASKLKLLRRQRETASKAQVHLFHARREQRLE